MVSFSDLPLHVRQKIYRYHPVYDQPITRAQEDAIFYRAGSLYSTKDFSPPLLRASDKIDKEAARIFYGEKTFDIAAPYHDGWWSFVYFTALRHRRLIRKLICPWTQKSRSASDVFRQIKTMKRLEELTIRVDEKGMIETLLNSSSSYQRVGKDGPTPQQQLVMLRYPGMASLLSLRVSSLKFVRLVGKQGAASGGPIEGGVLLTQVLPIITGSKSTVAKLRQVHSSVGNRLQANLLSCKPKRFPLLSLPPELRNRIYHMVLRIEGPVELSTRDPTSTSDKYALDKPNESVLSLLATNRQIHDEAAGIFYNSNCFVFNYSIHMHAFLQTISMPKQRLLRDITVHYEDVKSGGMSMVELTFDLPQHLTRLRRLEVVMHGEIYRKIAYSNRAPGHFINAANPGLLPGMKTLFSLRSIAEIKVRDARLEDEVEECKRSAKYPDFTAQSHHYCVVKLDKVLAHFNAALADAQSGRVNHELLKDNQWHLRAVFPTLDEA